MSHVLVVEDEQHLADGLRFNLEAEGYEVTISETGERALELLMGPAGGFDVLLLDVMLPGKSGFTVIAELRSRGLFIPTLMLTAHGRPEDVLRGFESGADDYLTKPFELAILLARLRGLLRRQQWSTKEPGLKKPATGQDVYEFRGRTVDFDSLELTLGERKLQLTLMEANLLRYFIQNEGKAVSRKTILEEIWGLHEDTDTRAIDNFIVRLRKHIEDEPGRPVHLQTVRGVGYRFVPQPED